ncbi:MAG: c-type cytochrome [Deltaproteobacteria bacterium]|nr:c-type cytochrome [Deltaproteobacteria bacterium]
MDQQARYDPQEPNPFFEDGRAMRLDVPGTVARGELNADPHYYTGKVAGAFAKTLPDQVKLTIDLLERGRERFDIYCATCHDRTGNGKGLITARGLKWGFVPPPSFHLKRIKQLPLGQLFDIASNGVRTMPGYRAQIPVADRWAIVSYLRALQVARTAPLDAVPVGQRADLKPTEMPVEPPTPADSKAAPGADAKAAPGADAKVPAPAEPKATAAEAKPSSAAAKPEGGNK